MNELEVSQKMGVLIALCLLNLLIVAAFLPKVHSVSLPRVSYIEIQDLSGDHGVAKLLFVFEEETGSVDFRERSTNWLVIEQFNYTIGIPIGRADPDWKLVGTNNVTVWHWRLEKTFYLQYQDNGDPGVMFPGEVFTVSFYIATNLSRWFIASTDIPNFSVSIDQQQVDYNQSSWTFQPQGCPYFLKIDLSVFHTVEYQFVVYMFYIVLIILILTAILLFIRRNDIQRSSFFRISSSIFIFSPVFLFTFRNSFAPNYLTRFDALCSIVIIIYGVLLLWRIAIPPAQNGVGAKDSNAH